MTNNHIHKTSVFTGVILFLGSFLSMTHYLKLSLNDNFAYYFILFIHFVFLVSSSIIIRFGLSPLSFERSQQLYSKFVNNNFQNDESKDSLFFETIESVVVFLLMQVPSLIFIWLFYFIGDYFIYVLIPTTIIFSIRILWKQQGMIIFQFLYIPILIMLFWNNQFFIINILCGTIIGALLFAKYFKTITIFKNLKNKFENTFLFAIYNQVIILSNQVYSSIYSKNNTTTLQSIVILMVFLFYIVGKYVFSVLPSEYVLYQKVYLNIVADTKDYIPYIAFILYVGLLVTNYLIVLSKPFSFKDEAALLKRGFNFTIIVTFGLFIMPFFIIFALMLAAILLSIGESILGISFLIFLGFFLFPSWIAKLFSIVLSLILLIIPEPLIKKYIDE